MPADGRWDLTRAFKGLIAIITIIIIVGET